MPGPDQLTRNERVEFRAVPVFRQVLQAAASFTRDRRCVDPALAAAARTPQVERMPSLPDSLGQLKGTSAAMRELIAQINRVAPTDATVLIVGESGTGKEAVARALHALSDWAEGPFIPVNCGAIPPTLIEAQLLGHEKGSFTGAERRHTGYFERAHGGTIFLDEITEMPMDMQVKLLRVLESRSFHRVGGTEEIEIRVRVLAATNRDVEAAVAEGVFRDDLLYRLAVFPLRVPPLRERDNDVLLLAQHFLDEINAREGAVKTFSRHCLHDLAHHSWPGNVRELKNAVSRAFILADQVVEFPAAGLASGRRKPVQRDGILEVSVGTPLADVQREMILATLAHYGGDKRQAARALGVSLKTLYNRLETYRTETTESAAG